MIKPSNFVMHSGYASLKNNDNNSVSVTVPNGYGIGPDGTGTIYADVVLGKSGGSLRARARVNNGSWMPATSIDLQLNVEIPAYGTGIIQNPYTAYVRWINPTTVRAQINIRNYADQALYVRSTYTFEFKINTFLPPM